jgi:hypothetical protein
VIWRPRCCRNPPAGASGSGQSGSRSITADDAGIQEDPAREPDEVSELGALFNVLVCDHLQCFWRPSPPYSEGATREVLLDLIPRRRFIPGRSLIALAGPTASLALSRCVEPSKRGRSLADGGRLHLIAHQAGQAELHERPNHHPRRIEFEGPMLNFGLDG